MCPNELLTSFGLGVVLSFSRENEYNQGNSIAFHERLKIHPLRLSKTKCFIVEFIYIAILAIAHIRTIEGTRPRKSHFSQNFKLGSEMAIALIYEIIAHTSSRFVILTIAWCIKLPVIGLNC